MRGLGINAGLAGLLVNVAGALLLVFLSWFAYLVAKRVVLRAIRFLSSKTSSDWDKVLIEHKVFARLSNVVPALVVHVLAPVVFAGVESWPVSCRAWPRCTSWWCCCSLCRRCSTGCRRFISVTIFQSASR